MIIACLGDSLTEGDYGVSGKRGIANVKEKNYPYFLGKITNAEVRNFGKCGFRASTYLKYYKDGNVHIKDADIVIIMLGTNGGHEAYDADTPDNAAYAELVELCMADAPRAKIFLCTPPHATSNPKFSNCGHAHQVKQAVEFVREFGKRRALPIVEVALCPDFTDEAEDVMQPNDGVHFGELGYETMARFIANNIL